MKKIKVRSPATTANLGAGFDVFGLALKEPHDLIEVEKLDENKIEIFVTGYNVPTDADKNTGGYVAKRMMEDFAISSGLRIKIDKNIRPASGLGSSAATAAGVAFALNQLFNLKLDKNRLVYYSSLGETVSAGVPHADNVSAAIYGGFTITVNKDPLEIVSFNPPKKLGIVVALPKQGKISTEEARKIIPKNVPMANVTFNVSKASSLAAGMITGNLDLIKKGMEDSIVETARANANILLEFNELRRLAKTINSGIVASGAGPAVIGIIEKERVKQLAEFMEKFFKLRNHACEVFITEAGKGVTKID